MLDREGYLRHAADVAGLSIESYPLPQDHRVRLGELSFRYLDWGRADDPLIVFLHGGGLTAHTWDLLCLSLCGEYRCLALDHRGHGDSDWSPDGRYTGQHHVEDVTRFFDVVVGERRAVLVGMSMGAFAALGFAAEHHQRLAGLVLVDIAPIIHRGGADAIRRFIQRREELPTVEAFVDRALGFNPRRRRDLLRHSLLNNLRQLPSGTWTWKYDSRCFVYESAEAAEAAVEARRQWWAKGGEISCPVLLVRGADSDVTDRETMETFAASLPRWSFVEVPAAGHTVQGDNPAGLLAELRPFLRELDLDA